MESFSTSYGVCTFIPHLSSCCEHALIFNTRPKVCLGNRAANERQEKSFLSIVFHLIIAKNNDGFKLFWSPF